VRRDYSGAWILLATILGSSMAFIDFTAVNVSLPVIQEDLGASITQLQWVIEAYALFLAALLLVGGTLGDRFGRRRAFIWGIGLFMASSIWVGLAPDLTQVIIARALQGVGAAIFVPGSLALIGACFTDDERGGAIGTWSAASALTTVIGPLLGGFLATNFSWRWVFFINVPIAVIVIVIAITRVPESRDDESGSRLDWTGAVLATVGLGALVYGLIEAANLGLGHVGVVVSLAAGVLGLAAFVMRELRTDHPMMPLGVFRSRDFSGANVLTFLLYGALGGSMFFFPLVLVQVRGYSPLEAGAAFLPFVFLVSTISRWAGGLVIKVGAKLPLVAGPAIVGVGFLLYARPALEGSYWTTYFPAVVAVGFGMAITISPLVTTVMSSVDQRRSGLASGVNNAVTRLASLVSIALFGLMALALFNAGLDDRLVDIGASPEIVQQLESQRVNLAGAQVPDGLPADKHAAVQRAIHESFVDAFRGVSLVSASLAFASALVALAVVGRRPRPEGAP